MRHFTTKITARHFHLKPANQRHAFLAKMAQSKAFGDEHENKYNKGTPKKSSYCRAALLLLLVWALFLYMWSEMDLYSSRLKASSSMSDVCKYSIEESLYIQRNLVDDDIPPGKDTKETLNIVTFHAGYHERVTPYRFGKTSIETVPLPPAYHNWRMSLHIAGYDPESITTLGESFTWGLNEDENWLGRTRAYLQHVKALNPSDYVVSVQHK